MAEDVVIRTRIQGARSVQTAFRGLRLQTARLKTNLISLGQGLDRVGAGLSRAGTALTLGVTVPAALASAAVIRLGMDAVESENLFEVSMGKMAKEGREFANEMSKSLGLNQFETRKTLGVFNQMLVSMTGNTKAAFDMSKGLTLLTQDMASFFNLSPAEAFQKLQAGITGEAEPLKRLGIIINEITVKNTALTEGIIKQGGTLTEAQKVQARYITIMKQTANAQGDMARTLDSPANKLRALKSRIEELGTEIGIALLPVMSKLIDVAGDVSDSMAQIFQDFKKATPEIKFMKVAILGFMLALGPLLKGMALLFRGLKIFALGFIFLISPIGLTAAAVALLVAIILRLTPSAETAREAFKIIGGAIDEVKEKIGNLILEFDKFTAGALKTGSAAIAKALDDVQDALGTGFDESTKKVRAFGVSLNGELANFTEQLPKPAKTFAERLQAAIGDNTVLRETVDITKNLALAAQASIGELAKLGGLGIDSFIGDVSDFFTPGSISEPILGDLDEVERGFNSLLRKTEAVDLKIAKAREKAAKERMKLDLVTTQFAIRMGEKTEKDLRKVLQAQVKDAKTSATQQIRLQMQIGNSFERQLREQLRGLGRLDLTNRDQQQRLRALRVDYMTFGRTAQGAVRLLDDEIEELNFTLERTRITSDNMINGLIDGMKRFSQESGNTFANFSKFSQSSLKAFQSALTGFLSTGELDFSSFIQSIKVGLAELVSKGITSVAAGVVTAGGQAVGATIGGTLGSAIGNFFSFGAAEGGVVPGAPGNDKADNVFAMLSPGEFVINAAATRQFKPLLAAINSGTRPGGGPSPSPLEGLGIPGFFFGGIVKSIFGGISSAIKKIGGFIVNSIQNTIKGVASGDPLTISMLASSLLLPGFGTALGANLAASQAIGFGAAGAGTAGTAFSFSSVLSSFGAAAQTSFASGILGSATSFNAIASSLLGSTLRGAIGAGINSIAGIDIASLAGRLGPGIDLASAFGNSRGAFEALKAAGIQLEVDASMQTGGRRVFTRPSLISVAEHGPEMVNAMPLASGGRGSEGLVIQVSGPAIFDDQSMSRFFRRAERELERRQIRFRG